MAKSRYSNVPNGLRKLLGEEGYDYLSRLNEAVFGADGKGGNLNLENIKSDGKGVLRTRNGRDLEAGNVDAEELTTSKTGILQGVDKGRVIVDVLNAETLKSNERTDRKSLESTSDGSVVFRETTESRVAGGVNMKPIDVPDPGPTNQDATMFQTSDGYLVVQNKYPDPSGGADRTAYKYLDLRSKNAQWGYSEKPPERDPAKKKDGADAPSKKEKNGNKRSGTSIDSSAQQVFQ